VPPLRDSPLACTRKPSIPPRRDDEPPSLVRRIGQVVPGLTESDQLVEVDVGSALRPLDDVVDIEGAPALSCGEFDDRERSHRVRYDVFVYPTVI
jgi:hypothetical protein